MTMVTQDRRRLFGCVVDQQMHLSTAGQLIHETWEAIPAYYPGVEIDAFVVMPDHFHGVVVLTDSEDATHTMSLPDVVHRFKSLTTRRYADGVAVAAWPAFRDRLWQRNYYERVVRSDRALQRIRSYIADNPSRWHLRSQSRGSREH